MSAFKDITVLLVDDMRVARMRMVETCRALGFQNIVEAVSGSDAWAKINAEGLRPGLILVDYNMPDMDGLEFLDLLREHEAFRTTPVLFVTAETEMVFIMKAVSVGVTEFVIKPYTTELLEKKIKAMLSKSA
jgi:two-component system chemotaxis response regulator CheY